jgi:hypothetical protein
MNENRLEPITPQEAEELYLDGSWIACFEFE